MKTLKMVVELLKNRRVWAGLIGAIVFGFHVSGNVFPYETGSLTDVMLGFGTSVAIAAEAGLALWSFLSPKKTTSTEETK